MRLVVDRPADHQVWQRSELLAGFVAGGSGAAVRATCGGVELTVRPCRHPRAFDGDGVEGFWTELVLQRHLDALRDGLLAVEFHAAGRTLATVWLRVSPAAEELARSYPLDLDEYPVPPSSPSATPTAQTIVFPGLGAVGGSSLNALMRSKALREGWATPVYDEANEPAHWARARAARRAPAWRWIDGHGCYAAADPRRESAARITLLRDPIRRLVSLFNYGTLVHPERFGSLTFDAFVGSGAAGRSSQAAVLLRIAGRHLEADRHGVALHRAARAELERGYAAVGITEDFEGSVFLFCRLAGYERIGMWRRVLAAPRAADVRTLASATCRRLTDDLAVDLELYEEVRGAFIARLAAADCGEALTRYRAAAARQPELGPVAKAVECLRWRQVLADHRDGLTIASVLPAHGSAA